VEPGRPPDPASRPLLPRVAVTVGDPAGIGPEIARRAAADPRVVAACRPVLYGPSSRQELAPFVPGRPTADTGRAAYDAVFRAVADARARLVDAVATGPISKEAFALAGLPWKGHTDLLASLCEAPRVAMLFHSPRLRVVLATVHMALSEVPRALTGDVIIGVVELAARELPRFGYPAPRLGMAALNPHAGEHGLMGTEDEDVIRPAVERCRAAGIDVEGPLPADTVFVRALRGEFDAVVACYHDQGLIPVKVLAFGSSVNVTLGLPIIRTSVDHGTAFDIAGRGLADHSSLVEAMLLAARLARG
jgi:4-phospho-D-threonate 3-dehydrogenase / 4-phospho-D-erythronate 3-dehydrogenase